MIENLFHAYTPLLTWTCLGFLLSRFLPDSVPKLLGRALYWVGVPLQILVLARHTQLGNAELIPWVAVGVLLLSMSLAVLSWWGWQWFTGYKARVNQANSDVPVVSTSKSFHRASLGSLMLAAMLGNTGFVGLALTEVLTMTNTDWAVLFSVTSNLVGNYGIAVFIASYFGQSGNQNHWWVQLRDVLTVPTLWAFVIGWNTRWVSLPGVVETTLEKAVWLVIAAALLLVGIRLASIKKGRGFKIALLPSLLKVVIVPLLVGVIATGCGLSGDQRLILVLMSGTPTGLSVLILAEVYELDRDLLASSIALTFVGLLLVLPLWLFWFG